MIQLQDDNYTTSTTSNIFENKKEKKHGTNLKKEKQKTNNCSTYISSHLLGRNWASYLLSY